MVVPLKFGNGYVILPYTLKLIHVSIRGPKMEVLVMLVCSNRWNDVCNAHYIVLSKLNDRIHKFGLV